MKNDRNNLPPLPSSLWEERYQTGNTHWDKGTHHPQLAGDFPKRWEQKKVLVPGVGNGHDAHRIAECGAQVTGIDFAPSAIRNARASAVSENETFLLGDVLHPPQDLLGQFDVIWEHTCFCALVPSVRAACIQAYASLLKPGGELTGIFYLSTRDCGSGPPFKIDPEELTQHLTQHLDIHEWRTPDAAFPGRAGEEVLIRSFVFDKTKLP